MVVYKFQYKICYSKIKLQNILKHKINNFNTKFVIAKLLFLLLLLIQILDFNTKFVIAKLKFTRNNFEDLKKFQYKICYSKILNQITE